MPRAARADARRAAGDRRGARRARGRTIAKRPVRNSAKIACANLTPDRPTLIGRRDVATLRMMADVPMSTEHAGTGSRCTARRPTATCASTWPPVGFEGSVVKIARCDRAHRFATQLCSSGSDHRFTMPIPCGPLVLWSWVTRWSCGANRKMRLLARRRQCRHEGHAPARAAPCRYRSPPPAR